MDINVFTVCYYCQAKVHFSPETIVPYNNTVSAIAQALWEFTSICQGPDFKIMEIIEKVRKTPNSQEIVSCLVHENEGDPFDEKNEEMWDLMHKIGGITRTPETENDILRYKVFFVKCPSCKRYAMYYYTKQPGDL